MNGDQSAAKFSPHNEEAVLFTNHSSVRQKNALIIGVTSAGKTSIIHHLSQHGQGRVALSNRPDTYVIQTTGPILYTDKTGYWLMNFIDTPGLGDHKKNFIPVGVTDNRDTQSDLQYYIKNLCKLGFRRDQFQFILNRTENNNDLQIRTFWDRIKNEKGIRTLLQNHEEKKNGTEYIEGVSLVRGSCHDQQYEIHLPRVRQTVNQILTRLAQAPDVGVKIPMPALRMHKFLQRAFDEPIFWIFLMIVVVLMILSFFLKSGVSL